MSKKRIKSNGGGKSLEKPHRKNGGRTRQYPRDVIDQLFPSIFHSEPRIDERGNTYRLMMRGISEGTYYRRLTESENKIIECIYSALDPARNKP